MKNPRRMMVGVLLLVGITTACDSGAAPPTSTSTPTPTLTTNEARTPPPIDPGVAALEHARELAAGYSYEAALNALAGYSGDAVEKERRSIGKAEDGLVRWPDNSRISHLFFHSLVVDPGRAFASGPRAQGYLDYMVTLDEFTKILEQVYANDYVLVAPKDVSRRNAKGELEYLPILLPPGKKPLVLSQDDVSYYEYAEGDGLATRLLVKDGRVLNEYEDAKGATNVGAYDVVPIVDAFIARHPDFSYRGARGILALTGYNGVFGYRTSRISYGDRSDLQEQQKKAKDVAQALKEEGWVFASHSWGHVNIGQISPKEVEEDSRKWDAEVKPILGGTDQYVYPFGADIAGVEEYAGPTWDVLRSRGFSAFYTVDASTTAWGQLHPGYLRQGRINVDGIRFAAARAGAEDVLESFFDVDSVIDPRRPSGRR